MLDNVAAALTGAGSAIDRLVQVRVYVTDIANWPAFNTIYANGPDLAPGACVVPVPAPLRLQDRSRSGGTAKQREFSPIKFPVVAPSFPVLSSRGV